MSVEQTEWGAAMSELTVPMRPKVSVGDIDLAYTTTKDGVSKVLDGVSLHARAGEFISIIGPSGCGKSSLFNVLAGLLHPDAGTICVDGETAIGATEHFAYMPQNDLLLPWRDVLDNTILGLEVQGVSRRIARERARELLPVFGLEGFAHSRPSALSGGMRQRAALLRTVLTGREVLLLDEPFGALDSLTRKQMQDWLAQLLLERSWTVVLITHDIDEAILLSDRIYVLTSRPARVREVLEVNLPRPRTVASTEEPEFLSIRRALIAALVAGHDDTSKEMSRR
ncbi:MAG: NitT/TauT family transport system ATP-binding protein [Solirubrobacteraceae bacterium]